MVDQQLVEALQRPADALRALPSGVYTTVVIDDGRVEAWDDHIARLSRSLECLLRQDGQLSAAHVLAAEGERKPAAVLTSLIAPSLAKALDALRDGQTAHGDASSGRQMATILLCSRPSSGCDARLRRRTLVAPPFLDVTPARCTQQLETAVLAQTRSTSRDRWPIVCVHAMPLPACVFPAPVEVAVVGGPRSDPQLKHSLWATQRCCVAYHDLRSSCKILLPKALRSCLLQGSLLH